MNRVTVVTPWTGSGVDGDYNRPLLADAFAVRSWADVTAQPVENLTPDPNAYTIETVCDDATLAAIEADERFVVLWSEEA